MQKLLAAALAVVMSASILTGCGNTAKESSEAKSSEIQSSEAQSGQAESSVEKSSEAVADDSFEHDPVIISEPGVEPFVSEDVTITIGLKSDPKVEDYDTNYYTLMLEETTGVNIEFILFPAGDEGQEKLQMMIAGGEELPDILMWGQTDAINCM